MNRLGELAFDALKSSAFWTPRTRISGNTIQGLVCPACGDKSAWAFALAGDKAPMSINCNRGNKCGARTSIVELFNIKINIEKEYPPNKEDKHRPARMYLESRGLKESLKGLTFEYWPKVRKETKTGAVMFPLQTPDGSKRFNGRLLNPEPGVGKTHNSSSTAYCYWLHPGITYNPDRNTFVTEGIINALSMIELGEQAVAVLSSGTDPATLKFPPIGKLVIAFDNDRAGIAATRKWLSAYPDSDAILPDKGQDWNDLLKNGDKQ